MAIAGCAATGIDAPSPGGEESGAGGGPSLRLVPSVFVDEDAYSACSAQRQDPNGSAQTGYTCLEILFATDRALAERGVKAMNGVAGKPEDPRLFFKDARFSSADFIGDPGYFRPSSDADRSALDYESYRAGRIFVTVPKREPGDQLKAYDYKTNVSTGTSRTPTDADRQDYFTVWNYELLQQDDFWSRAGELLELAGQSGNPDWMSDSRAALVFIHGYNTSVAGAAYRMSQIVYDLRFAGAPFMFSWPANSDHDPLQYFNDSSAAAGAVGDLKLFLLDIEEKLHPSKFVIIAHSHGNQLLLRTLNEIAAEHPGRNNLFDAIIFASPDVDAFEFKRIVERTKHLAPSKTLYTSSDDKANLFRTILNGVRKNILNNVTVMPRAGYVKKGGTPLIADGLESIDLTGARTGRLGPEQEVKRGQLFKLFDGAQKLIMHDQYANAADIIYDIRAMIDSIEPVKRPDCRTAELNSISVTTIGAPDVFWRYKRGDNKIPADCP